MKRTIVSLAVAVSLVMAPLAAVAQTPAPQQQSQTAAPLPPAGAAGVQQAQNTGLPPWAFWVGGVLLIGAGIWLLTDTDDDEAPPPITTTTTAP